MGKIKKIFIAFIFLVFIISLGGILYLNFNTYSPMVQAIDEMNRENVYIEDNTIIFEPSKNVAANFIFYPGGLVKPESYAVLAQMLADEGVRVFIPRMPFNLAILNQNAYKDIIQNSSYMEDFYIGGHSLGGATAAIALSKEATPFKGVIFLAGYGTEASNLTEKNIKALSITAENDGVFNWERYEDYKDLLPNDSMFYTIGGGNHAGFGFYGEQKGDGIAEITREVQHKITVERIVDFIKEK